MTKASVWGVSSTWELEPLARVTLYLPDENTLGDMLGAA